MDKSLKIAVILSAYDKMSGIIDKAVNGSIKKLTKLQQTAEELAKKSFATGRQAGVIGLALAAPLVYATNKAIDFEDKMADVAKVFNVKVGSSQFEKYGDQAKDLSVYLSKSAEESAGLMASLGQGGVQANKLVEISKAAGQIGVAFDLTADVAGDRYTKLKNALNSSWQETKRVTDAINYLSDNQASKASEILDFMAAGGAGVARASKTAGQELAAMGSYLISIGKSGAESATIMQRFYKGIMKNDGTRDMFNKAGGGASGMMAVLQKGASIKDSTAQFKYFQQFGEYGADIRLMASNMDALRGSVNSVADASQYAGSVEREFLNRNSTSRGKINKSWAELNRIILDFGANGIPIVLDFLKAVKPILEAVSTFVKNNRELSTTLFKVVGGLAAFSLMVSGVSFAVGGVATTISFFSKVLLFNFNVIKIVQTGLFFLRYHLVFTLWPALVSATTAVWGFTAALLANPVTWIVVAVMALVAAVYLAYKNFDKLKAGFMGVIAVGKMIIAVYAGVGKALLGVLTFNPAMIASGLKDAGSAVKKILDGGISTTFKAAYDKSMSESNAKKAKAPVNANKGFSMGNPGIQPAGGGGGNNYAFTINMPVGSTKDTVTALKKVIVDTIKEHDKNKARVAY